MGATSRKDGQRSRRYVKTETRQQEARNKFVDASPSQKSGRGAGYVFLQVKLKGVDRNECSLVRFSQSGNLQENTLQ